ncbi:hypothetical protein [Sporosarcina psychrophila]|uniref:Cthe-2314-like HEPN domain-containing protein n=1 Tax=Sporosarcina psychrophila TaxID=1476 RepID=A0ABV2KCQ0_SPOPS
MEDIHEAMAIFNLQRAIDSYPRLDNLQYFRQLNLFIENTFNEKLEETGGSNKRGQITFDSNEPKEKLLTVQVIRELSEEKKYKSFQNLMRPSLLITLCSFIENIFTYPVYLDANLKHEFDKIKKKSDLNKARIVLVNKGYEKLRYLEGIKYVNEMNRIRNRFVHHKGEATEDIKKLTSQYDFEVVNNHIVLGEKFIENYIAHLENFAVKVAKIIYENESWVHKMLQKYPNLRNINDTLDFMKKNDITIEQLSSIEIPNRR